MEILPSASIVEGTLNMVLGRENNRNMREFHEAGGVHHGVQRG